MSSQPMLQIRRDPSADPRTVAHLLPCRVHHDGVVEPVRDYWTPKDDGRDGVRRVAYFRGRKLHGTPVQLPEGYEGVVLSKGGGGAQPDKAASREPTAGAGARPAVVDLEQDDETPCATDTVEAKAAFDEVVVWGHETTADASSDAYVRGLEEWLALAEQMHSYPDIGGSEPQR
ncbi:hypothetical protein VTK73DRAFT_4754 [Phialemonium thermophilum]|uniref:Uncharacterized protein n=1 Tax=Phialemonium thermophilum TaxID=223376 RepID=A0ABR3V661_9PEZI